VQAGAVLFFSLLHGKNAATEVGDLGQFLLDFLKSFMPLAVSHLSFCFGVGLTAVLLVQLLELSDFSAKIPDLFTKHCEMIHDNRIAHLKQFFKRYQGMVVAKFGSLFLELSPGSPARFSQREGSPRGPVSEEIRRSA
jgi:hypothetical protein